MRILARGSLAGALVVVVVLAVWWGGGWSRQAGEPTYQGRKLSEWLGAFSPAKRNQPGLSPRDATRAVRVAGTNAFPLLFDLLQATDPPMRTKLNSLLQKQHWVSFRFRTAQDLHYEAELAFSILGQRRAAAAVPALLKLYGQQTTDDDRALIASLLGQIGPGAKAAVPTLAKAVASTNMTLHIDASNALQQITPREVFGLSGRFNGLLDTDPRKQELAARDAVNQDYFGRSVLDEDHAPAMMSAIIELAQQTNGQNYWVKFLLTDLDPDLAARVLTNESLTAEKRIAPVDNPPESTRADAMGRQGARLLAVGDWSEPVNGSKQQRLRGRLLVYAGPHYTDSSGEWWGNAMVNVELQDVTPSITILPMTVYFDLKRGLDFELRDAQGQEVTAAAATEGTLAEACWVSIPFDGSVRLRADRVTMVSHQRPDGLTLSLANQSWHLAAVDTNSYFLSAKFTPPIDPPDPLDYDAFDRTLILPAVKIAVGRY